MKIKKLRLILCIMFFVLVLGFGDDVNAQEISGPCGEGVIWTVRSDGSLTISGDGKMEDFGFGKSPWHSAADLIQNITISGNIENIGEYAFQDCSSVTNIVLPDSVINIAPSAFSYCKSLSSITIPGGVINVGSDAFYECSQLKDIYFKGTLSGWCKINFDNSWSQPMFYGSNLYISDKLLSGGIVIPDDITSIKNHTFYNCSALTGVEISENVVSIGDAAFFGCRGITDIVIPDSVTSIGNGVFSGCSSLTDIEFPENMTSITNNMFAGCRSLASIIIPDMVTSIGEEAFARCDALAEVVIPNSVKSIEKGAFNNSGLISISIPDSVESIGEEAFYCCYDLVDVKLSGGMTRVEDKAFYCCYSMKSISIPESIIYIGFGAFYFRDHDNLEYIFYGGTSEQWDSVRICNYTIGENNELSGAVMHYSSLDHIWGFEYIIDKEPTCVADGSKSFHCSVCDAINNNSSISVPKNENHITELRNQKEATCTLTGYTGDQVCTVCGKTIETGTVIPVKQRVEATGKFALLKKFLKEKGRTDDYGDKYFYDVMTISEQEATVAIITYREDVARFQFSFGTTNNNQVVSKINFFIDENGSRSVTVFYSHDVLSLEAKATFDVSSYRADGNVYFEKTAPFLLDNDRIQDVCNAGLKIAFDAWDMIFLQVLGYDVNMADMGFVSYEEAGKHTGSGVVTKSPTCYEKGIKTYTCVVCGYVATEEIDMIPHQWNGYYTIDKNATRTKNGIESIHCRICNAVKSGSVRLIPKNSKKSQNIRVTTNRKISVKKLKSKAQSFKLSARSTSGEKVKYKLVKKNKNIRFTSSSGKVTVKKGTKKGTYKIQVRMTVSQNKKYNAYSTVKTIKIKVQ